MVTEKLYITASDAKKMTNEAVQAQKNAFNQSVEERLQSIFQEIETRAKQGYNQISVNFAANEASLMSEVKFRLSNIGYGISDDGRVNVKVSW